LTWAREHAPVYWHAPTAAIPDGEGFWVISRHEDAMAIVLDPAGLRTSSMNRNNA
jgi:hypothetical protein